LDMTRKMCETTVPVPCLMQSPNSKSSCSMPYAEP
jgi:hypothetical protein